MKNIWIIALAGMLAACGTSSPEAGQTETETTAIQLTEEQVAFNEIVTGRLPKGAVFHKVKATGLVDIPPNYSVRYTAPIGGYLSTIKVLPGDRVSKGQVLAVLTHPDIAQLQQDYLAARSRLNFIQKDLERKGELLEGKSVAQRDYDQLESEAVMVSGELQSLTQELRRLDINYQSLTSERITQSIQLKAPISGLVTDLWGKSGDFMDASSPVLSILNRDHEHVELQIFQDDLDKIHKGMTVLMKLPKRTETYIGEVFLVNTKLDMETLAANIHVHPGENFPEQPINAVVFGEVIHRVDSGFVLPSAELIRAGAERFVFMKTPEGFVKTPIQTGYDDGTQVLVNGPSEIFGQEVVLRGNYYLNGE